MGTIGRWSDLARVHRGLMFLFYELYTMHLRRRNYVEPSYHENTS